LHVGIVIALPNEWGYFKKAFHLSHEHNLQGRRHYTGRFGRVPVSVVLSGVGKENAKEAVQALSKAHKLSVLLSIGYAGALSPELKRGDIVLSSYSRNNESPEALATDHALAEKLRGLADESHEHHVYVSPLYTADKIIARHEEKRQLFERSGSLVVDMESLSVYTEAMEQKIPFIGVHAITDTAEEDIPALEIINPFLLSNSWTRYPKIFWDIAKRPKSIWDMALLNHDAKVAGNNLTHFLMSNRANLGDLLSKL
jgi:adenosylhomocysteine nucleosidase